jgi:hypothetical protein
MVAITVDKFVCVEGVAVGCGWQAFVAYVNVGCYYLLGIPLGVLLGFKFDLGAKVILLPYLLLITFILFYDNKSKTFNCHKGLLTNHMNPSNLELQNFENKISETEVVELYLSI